ncbi:arylsulfatase [Verrucomicrobiaceae bacterium N1E253]|uniref:Arylsulfatase n=1 Tax=Oceaniferula marina TaxID=2748318 RepID=A0A851G9Y2_9BACT|nr:arylsulfatase [Oceaniferula marina]NWK54538.1 arylsulfatase [Oceaniferula marina]
MRYIKDIKLALLFIPLRKTDETIESFKAVRKCTSWSTRVPSVLLLGISILSLTSASGKEIQPNIILVMTDDQGYADLGCHGHPFLKTPNIDKLYGEAIRFTDFHASPACAPTRSALMSGKAPFKVGVTHTAEPRARLKLGTVTVAEALKSNGYVTGIFGKWHLGWENEYQPENRGFDEVFIHGGGGIARSQPKAETPLKNGKEKGYFNPFLKHNGSFVQTEGYCTDVFFQQALGWMKSNVDQNKPFFAYIATNAPHSPYIVDPKYSSPYKDKCDLHTANFYGMISNTDENMGTLMSSIDKWGIRDNTILIFMTDNGSSKGSKVYNAGMKGKKCQPSEGGAKVPLFIRWPQKLTAGLDVDRLTRHYDLFPTLLDLSSGQLPAGLELDGRSMVPLMKNPQTKEWEDRNTFIHVAKWPTGKRDKHKYANFAVRNERWRLEGPFKKNNTTLKDTRIQLYDIKNDPGQTTDVSKKHPEIYKKMLSSYEQWWELCLPLMINEDADAAKENPFLEQYEKQRAESGIPKWTRPRF